MLNLEKRAPGTIQMADGTDGVLFYDTNDNLAIKLNNGDVSYVSLSTSPAPKVIKGFITQSGVDTAPVVVTAINTTGATITPTYGVVGTYSLTASSPIFTEGKTITLLGSIAAGVGSIAGGLDFRFYRVSDTEITIETTQANFGGGAFDLANDLLLNNPFSIEIYE